MKEKEKKTKKKKKKKHFQLKVIVLLFKPQTLNINQHIIIVKSNCV